MNKKAMFGGGMGTFSFSSFIKGFLLGVIVLGALLALKLVSFLGFLCPAA